MIWWRGGGGRDCKEQEMEVACESKKKTRKINVLSKIM